jgi:hypothetical protein
MCLFQYAEDPEPEEPVPAGPLCVPVRPGGAVGGAAVVIRLFRTPLGERTAVGFTDPDKLAATLGEGGPWIALSESALRALAGPLGVVRLTVDPTLSAPAVAAEPDPGAVASPSGERTRAAAPVRRV